MIRYSLESRAKGRTDSAQGSGWRGPETPDVRTMVRWMVDIIKERTLTIVHLCDTKVLERPQGVGKETAEADNVCLVGAFNLERFQVIDVKRLVIEGELCE